jgi:predicted permease
MTDLRLAIRLARRHALLSLAAVLSLALGIGANTAIFTVLNHAVLRPLPYDQPDRVMVVWETMRGNLRRAVAPANFLDWRRETTAFSGLAGFDDFPATLTGLGEAERVRTVSASANFFEVLGVRAAIGRVMTASEDRAGAEPVAVLSDGLWHRLFASAASAIGQKMVLNGIAYTVVGVLPASFDMAMVPGAEVWVSGDRGIPRSFPYPGDITSVRDSHLLAVIGRLADGATPQQAQAQLDAVMSALSPRYPQSNAGLGANVVPLHEEVVGDVRPLVVLLQVAVALLLLIACANVAHLLLGQAAGRQTEMSLRVALGAARGRLIRQLLAETFVLAVPGGVMGLLFAAAGIRALVAAAPASVPRLGEIAIDGSVLTFTLAMTLLTMIVFGFVPAWSSARTSASALAQGSQRLTGGTARRWQQAIVIGELALAQMLLVGAGLLLVSFVQATRIDLGFATDGRVAAELNLTPEYVKPRGDDGLIDPARKIQFITRVLDQVSQQSGVRAVAASFTAPLTGAPNRGIRIEGDPAAPANDQPNGDFQIITPDFFRAMGMTLQAGRAFDSSDRADSTPVVIVNQALVRKYFAGREALGQVLLFGGSKRHTIVGIVNDARYRSIEQPADPTFYLPLTQNDERWPFLTFMVWSDSWRAGASAPAVLRAAVREADPGQPISRLRSIDEIVSHSMAPRRFNTWLVALFAGAALLLAAIGTYGVMAFAVTSRTRELGLRAALGAAPRDLSRMVLGQGLALTAGASVLGLVAATVATRFMASMLFGVAPRDPWTFAGVAAVLSTVAIIATLVPAWRAMRVDPMVALREP